MNYDINPPCNPNYIDVGAIRAEECYDLDSAGSPNTQQAGNSTDQSNGSARQVGGAAVAGAVAGLAVSGPIIGVAAGGAAAYAASTHSGTAGNAARQTGAAVASAGDKAKEVNDRHELTKRSMKVAKGALGTMKELNERHRIVHRTKKATASGVQKAKEIDEKYKVVDKSKGVAQKVASTAKNVDEKHRVTEKTKVATSSAVAKAREVNERHRVAEKTKGAAATASKKVALGVKFLSKSMAGKKPANDTVATN